MSFSAVVTTGIYCRPGCGGRPHAKNVRPFYLAAAAEAAGFRACLQCRPYRTPQKIDLDAPELVCRAVRLILGGALNEATEDDLGARLGISARHLRRMFVEHVGATPDQLARSSRTHFARRLLDDTDLTITEVAFASGFGSTRQFNRACLEIFRSTPRELRARRRKTDRLVADGGLALRLPLNAPLDWEVVLAYFSPRIIAGVEAIEGDTYRRTIVVDGDPGVLELSPGGPDHLVLRAHLPHWEGLIHIVEGARRVVNLDEDVAAGAEHLRGDPLLSPLIEARPDLPIPGTWDPFEVGIRAIVGQQVSVAGATTMIGRLAQRHGSLVPGLEELGLSHTFPPAEALAAADLGGLGLTGVRERAIRAFAAAVVGGEVRLDRSAGLEGFVDSMVQIPGLGPWTAHYIALRMGEPDAFPATDLGLRRSLERLDPGTDLTPATRSETWRPWRALAAVHLWTAP